MFQLYNIKSVGGATRLEMRDWDHIDLGLTGWPNTLFMAAILITVIAAIRLSSRDDSTVDMIQ